MRKLLVVAATAALFSCSKPATTPVEVSADDSTLTASPTELVADGVTASDVTVLVKDTAGKTLAGADVSLTIEGSAKADAQTAKTDDSGSARFKVTSTVVGANAISATVNGKTALSQKVSLTFIAGPAATLWFRVQPSSAQERKAIAPAVVVEARDAQGNPASGFTGAVTITLTTPAGAVLGGTTTATAAGGVATFSNLSVDRPGSYTLKAVSTGMTDATSASFTVTVLAPSALAFGSQPQGTTSGATLAPFSVTFQDADGNVLRGSTGDVALAIATGPTGGTLGGTATVTAVDGIATFSDLSFTVAGDYTLAATSASVTGATSNTFTIAPGTPARLAFVVQPVMTEVRTSMTVSVAVLDISGNTVTSSTAPVALTLGGMGTLLGTPTRAAASGIANFTGLSVTQEGAFTLTAFSGSLMPATSASFMISDTTPPAQVTLTVSSKTQSTVALAWTAVGDDGVLGNSTSQQLRYSTAAITPANFSAATQVTVGAPAPTGMPDTATVTGLTAATTYFFALRVVDSAGNASLTVISDTTAGCPTGYAGPNCDQCAAGYRLNGMVCEDYCVGDPCNPPPPNMCSGNTAVVESTTRTCTPGTTTPFFTCSAPRQTDCTATMQYCLNAACINARVPAAGDLVITEIMHTSALGTMGQWFEVANVSGANLILDGLKIETVGGTGVSFTMPSSASPNPPRILQTGALFVFGARQDLMANGGATVDYEYGPGATAFDLSTPKRLKLSVGAVTVTDLDYGVVTPATTADIAVQLASVAVGKGSADQQSWYWCAATATLSGGGKGTPKGANGTCGIALNPPLDYCILQFPKTLGVVDATRTIPVFAQFYEPSVTDRNPNGNDFYPNVVAELGFGLAPVTGPADPTTWTWIPAGFNPGYVDSDPNTNNDEMVTNLVVGTGGQITASGDYVYGYRFRMIDPATGAPSTNTFCDQNGTVATPTTAGTWGTLTAYAPSAQIAAARAATDGTGLTLSINGARVTYVKPAIGSDPAGFFVQGEQTGPALFIAVNPTTLTPVPVAGDRVSFTVSTMATAGTLRQATAITGFTRISQGNPLATLVQDVGAANDLVTNLGTYESELLKAQVTVTSPFVTAGPGYVSAFVDTAGVTASTDLKFRLPQTLQNSMDLAQGCVVSVTAPLWRLNAQAQVSAWAQADVTVVSCPAPRVLSASGSQLVKVHIAFDRVLDATSVLADGSQFTITSGILTVTGAQVSGPAQVTLTTSTQSAGTYTVTVAANVRDQYGAGVNPAFNSATFAGPAMCSPSQVVISQVYGGGGNAGATFRNDFVELHNKGVTTVTLANFSVQYASTAGTTWVVTALPAMLVLQPGAYYLIQQGNGGGTGGVTLAPIPDLVAAPARDYAGSNGKVALVSSVTALTGACPTTGIIDFVGYGTANCFEGTAAAAALTSSTAAIRNLGGCSDNGQNSTDFTAATPAPRNTSSTALDCNCN